MNLDHVEPAAAGAVATVAATGGVGAAHRVDCQTGARSGLPGYAEGASVQLRGTGVEHCAGWSLVTDGSREGWVENRYLEVAEATLTATPERAAPESTPTPSPRPATGLTSSPDNDGSAAGAVALGLVATAATGGVVLWRRRRPAAPLAAFATPVAPLSALPAQMPSLWERLRRRPPARGALAELTARLEADPPTALSDDLLASLSATYRVDVGRRFASELVGVYEAYLARCLQDRRLDERERQELARLRTLLGVGETAAASAHDRVAGALYRAALSDALGREQLDPQLRAGLEALERELELSREAADLIFGTLAQAHLQSKVEEAIGDGRLSPDEDAQLQAIAASLGVTLTHDRRTGETLDRYRRYWQIEQGTPPTVAVDIRLQRGEVCYFTTICEWYEHRSTTKRVRYAGPTFRVRIAKGLYWRMGDLGVQRVTEDELRLIDRGQLYLTNKRVIFTGPRGNKTIQLKRILDFNLFQNGVDIQKDAGKSPFLQFSTDLDLCALYLDRALRDLG